MKDKHLRRTLQSMGIIEGILWPTPEAGVVEDCLLRQQMNECNIEIGTRLSKMEHNIKEILEALRQVENENKSKAR